MYCTETVKVPSFKLPEEDRTQDLSCKCGLLATIVPHQNGIFKQLKASSKLMLASGKLHCIAKLLSILRSASPASKSLVRTTAETLEAIAIQYKCIKRFNQSYTKMTMRQLPYNSYNASNRMSLLSQSCQSLRNKHRGQCPLNHLHPSLSWMLSQSFH